MSTVIYLENGLTPQRRRIEQHSGTIAELAPAWQTPFVAFVDGKPVLRADWELVLEDDQTLAFIDADAIPQGGGGGGGGGSNPLRTILTIAVMVYAPTLAQNLVFGSGIGAAAALGSTGLAMFNAGAMFVGMSLVNAIAPPPKPTSPQQAAALAAPSPTYSLQAQGNSARLEAAIPEHFGRMICYPDLAAQPYTEFEGNEQYLYVSLCIGRGEYELEAFKVEDTGLENFNEITYEIVRPGETLDLFPADVVSSAEVSGQTMDGGVYVGPFVASWVGSTANYIGIDFVAPRGFYYANDDGSLSAMTATATVEARLVDAYGNPAGAWVALTDGVYYSPWSDWMSYVNPALQEPVEYRGSTVLVQRHPANTLLTEYQMKSSFGLDKYAQYRTRTTTPQVETFTAATNTPQRYSRRYPVAPGRYEVRVKRIDTEQTSSRYGHNLVWGGMRAYLKDDTRTFGDVTLIGMRMRASDNLSAQANRKINCVATRKIPVWNGSTWSANTATRSPAWAIAYACKQVGLTDAQIDLSGLLTLANGCAARGDNFDARFDNFLSFWEAVSKMAGAVRAKPFLQAGVLRVVRDQASTIPVALFSQRNIIKGSLSVNYLMPTEDTADSVDVGYFDEVTWKPARVRSTIACSAAAKPAKVDIFGVVKREQAWREGLYQAACNRFRRKIITFQTEMEGFIPSFGDLIAIQHDMPAWGQGGEVVAWDAGTKTLTLSEPPTFSTGTHYIALRKRDGSVDGPYVAVATVDPFKVLLMVSPTNTPYTGQTEERTHYAFGEGIAWRQPARVLSAKPQGLHLVEIEAVNEDDSVHTADAGVTMPAQQFSGLASFQSAPSVQGVTAYPAPFAPSKLLVQWAPAAWADHYYIEQSADGIAWTRSAEVSANNVTIQKLFGLGTLVRVAAVGLSRGPWMQVAVTPSPVPETVSSLMIDGVKLSWPAVSDQDIVGYRIKYQYGANLEWGTATPLYDGLVTSSPYEMRIVPPGQITIMVRAVDSEGQESPKSAYVIKDMGDALVANVLESYDFKAAGWPGSLTNAAPSGGNILAIQGYAFYRTDASNFYPESSAAFYSDNYDGMIWESAGWTPDAAGIGQNMTAAWTLTGNTPSIQYRQTGNTLFYASDTDAFYSDDSIRFYDDAPMWQTWPGNIVADAQEYQWRVLTGIGPTIGLLSAFAVSVDVPDKALKLNGITIAPGGTRLTGAIGQFSALQNVQLTLQGGSTAVLLEVQDKSITLGPLITAKNAAGTGVTATIDALLQGY